MNNSIFETSNRKLEQTLYNLGVHHLSWHKDIDGMTVWVYPNNEKVRQIVTWFREAYRHRDQMGW